MESLSGIRGIYGNGITEALARRYVFAYCKLFENKLSKIIIAGDSRPSTPSLKKAAVQAFIDCGVKQVINVGIVPIQVAEHAVQTFQAQGGLYISASHNEPEYNGFKFLKNDGAILYPEQSGELIKLAHNQGKVDSVDNTNEADIKDMSRQAIKDYIDFVLKRLGEQVVKNIKKSKFKVLADPNGGSALTILNKFFAQLGVEAKIINNKLGEFNRLIEPKPESLAPLTEEIKNSEFAFACGFDCDADRVELVIDPNSAFAKEMEPMLDGNYVMALVCDIYLEGTDNQVVVTNTATSPLVRDVIQKHKATAKEAELGEMAVVKEMENQNSIIGGEGSNGGVIMPPIKCRDGLMTIALILKMMAQQKKTISEILMSYPRYYSDRVAIKCSAEQGAIMQDKLEKYFREQGMRVNRTKDTKVWVDNNSYIWFHQSGTDLGTFRIIVDSDNKQKTHQLLELGVNAFNKLKE